MRELQIARPVEQGDEPYVADASSAFLAGDETTDRNRTGLTFRDLGEAIFVWSHCVGAALVGDVAETFDTAETMVAAAVAEHPWLAIAEGRVFQTEGRE